MKTIINTFIGGIKMDLFLNVSPWVISTAGIVFVLLMGITVLYSDSKRFHDWWNKHICGEFPHPEECWDCKRGSCVGCNVIMKGDKL